MSIEDFGDDYNEGYLQGMKDLVCNLTEAGVITDWDLTHDSRRSLQHTLFLSTDDLDSEREASDYSREASLALDELFDPSEDHRALPTTPLTPTGNWEAQSVQRPSHYVVRTQGGGRIQIQMTNYSSAIVQQLDLSKACDPHEEGVLRLLEVGEDREARYLVGAWELNRIKALGVI